MEWAAPIHRGATREPRPSFPRERKFNSSTEMDPRFRGVRRVAAFMSVGGPQADGHPDRGSRRHGEIGLGGLLSTAERAHGDKEIMIGKKRTPEFRYRGRIRCYGDDGDGRDADRKTGGPRYLLSTVPENALSNQCDTA